MKLRNIICESPQIPVIFKKLFADFPRDATKWSQASDEIRDVCRIVRETYNEIQLNLTSDEVEDGEGIQSLNFRSFKTPSEWNSKAAAQIVIIWNKMKTETRNATIEQLKKYHPRYF